MINESPDRVYLDDGTDLGSYEIGSFAFGYYDGKMRVSKERGIHAEVQTDYDDMNGDYKSYVDVPISDRILRDDFKLGGRIWTEEKVLSFWRYPKDPSQMKGVLKDLKKELKNKRGVHVNWNNEWKVEVISGQEYGGDRDTGSKDEEIIGLDFYTGSGGRSDKELAKKHIQSPMDKVTGRQKYKAGKVKGKKDIGNQKKKQKQRTRKFGYSGDDYEPSMKIKRFREIIREMIKNELK